MSQKLEKDHEWFQKGRLKLKEKCYDEAIECFSKAIEFRPIFVEAYVYRGHAWSYLRNEEYVCNDFSKALELCQNNSDLFYGSRNARILMDKHQESDWSYADSLGSITGIADIYNYSALAKIFLADFEGAIEDCTKAIKLRPYFADAYSNRASARCAIFKYEIGVADFSMAIALKPNVALNYSKRGIIKCFYLKDPEDAIIDFNHALDLNPGFVYCYYNRGCGFLALNKKNEALADLTRAKELGYNVPQEQLDKCK